MVNPFVNVSLIQLYARLDILDLSTLFYSYHIMYRALEGQTNTLA